MEIMSGGLFRRAYKLGYKALAGRRVAQSRAVRALHAYVLARIETRRRAGPIKIQGRWMHLDPQDSMELYAKGHYEPFETELVQRLIGRGNVVIDVGAHIGYYALMFADLVGPNGRVYAFEPDPGNHALLKRNIEVNGYQNIISSQTAVSDNRGAVKLYLSRENSGDNRIYGTNDERDAITVPSIRLDDFFRDRGFSVDFIKMDIQGAEWMALRGMAAILKGSERLRMLIEYWPIGIGRSGGDPKEFLDWLQVHGFQLYELDRPRRRVELIELEAFESLLAKLGYDGFTNLLCLRSSDEEGRTLIARRSQTPTPN